MNKLVIAVLIAACFAEVMSTRTVERTRKRIARTGRTAPAITFPTRKPQPISKPISNENQKIDTSKSTDTTDSKSTALAEIPVISSEKEMLIEGTDGKIIVNGVTLYKDEKFKSGQVRWEVINNNVYINGNLVAKNPQDGTANLPNPNVDHKKIAFFTMKIHEGGILEYSHDGQPSSWWM